MTQPLYEFTTQAPAKLNLTLYIAVPQVGASFHPISSFMVKLPWLSDTLTLKVYPSDALSTPRLGQQGTPLGCHSLTLEGSEVSETLQTALTNNLVTRAIEVFTARDPLPTHFHYAWQLTKSIPSEAGLGGGSSDAAAALLLLNQLRKVLTQAYPFTAKRLCQLFADAVGSDVGFFLYASSLALATGRGNTLQPYHERLRVSSDIQVLIFRPKHMKVSTPWAYQQFRDTQKYYQRLPEWDFSDRYRLDWSWIKTHAYNSFQTMLMGEAPETHWFSSTLLEAFYPLEGLPLLCGSGACWAWLSPETLPTLQQTIATHEALLAQHFDTVWFPTGERYTLGTYALEQPIHYPEKTDPWWPTKSMTTALSPYLTTENDD